MHTYTRTAHPELILRDTPRSLTFKFNKEEYFSGVSSLLEMLSEALENSRRLQKPPTVDHIELLRALREEVDFLQHNCHITQKD